MSAPLPSDTPNIVIASPRIRIIVRTILDSIGGLTAIAMAVDASSPVIDIAPITIPILAGYTAARVVFGFGVDTPNTPRE